MKVRGCPIRGRLADLEEGPGKHKVRFPSSQPAGGILREGREGAPGAALAQGGDC